MQFRPPHFQSRGDADSAPLRLVSSHSKAPRANIPRPRQVEETDAVAVEHIPALLTEWLEYCEMAGQSKRTNLLRAELVKQLLWFLNQHSYADCGSFEMRKFFLHLINGHNLEAGRWGQGSRNRGREPLRPATLSTYYRHLSSFFKYLTTEGIVQVSPMSAVPPQQGCKDKKEPFTLSEVRLLIRAARKSRYPKRNELVIRLLLDTGMRVSELCGLTMKDIDLHEGKARILGKGNKYRSVSWGHETKRLLRVYLQTEYFAEGAYGGDDPLLLAEGNNRVGQQMTPNGVRLLIRKLGKRAGLTIAQCSPHVFRHTFAVEFIKAGGTIESLQECLGHETIAQSLEYVNMARVDAKANQRKFSPGDRLGKI